MDPRVEDGNNYSYQTNATHRTTKYNSSRQTQMKNESNLKQEEPINQRKKKPIAKKEKEKGNVNINKWEQKITVNPPLISYIVTHEHHIKFGTVYLYQQTIY